MTVSMPTTRLSLVMTGCGGKLTTCSRRSMRGRRRSMNGITRFSPACSVRWYLPNRSTMPARACGTIRTARATANMARPMTRTIRTIAIMVPITIISAHGADIPHGSSTVSQAPTAVRNGRRALTHASRASSRYLAGPGPPPVFVSLDLQRNAEAPGEVLRGKDVLDGARGKDGAAAQQHRMGEAVWHFFDVVGDQHHHRRLGVVCQRR